MHEGEMAYYWGATLDTYDEEETAYARDMALKLDYINKGCISRYYGLSIRPVVSLSDINKLP